VSRRRSPGRTRRSYATAAHRPDPAQHNRAERAPPLARAPAALEPVLLPRRATSSGGGARPRGRHARCWPWPVSLRRRGEEEPARREHLAAVVVRAAGGLMSRAAARRCDCSG